MIRAVVLLLLAQSVWAQVPRLLLTPSRLHRLQKDRERNTPRWENLERRIHDHPDSPERGFELALYAIVSGDGQSKNDAIAWAQAHPCDRWQSALIQNWLQVQTPTSNCASTGGPFTKLRDDFFSSVAQGQDFHPPALQLDGELPDAKELYALIEFLDAYRSHAGEDLRAKQSAYFRHLPELFLLARTPDQVLHPSPVDHIAALAIVSLDPNLEASQFLQSWAMESRFVVNDGEYVADELLWANPYLPGLGYENMPTFLYLSDASSLWARTDWNADSCWVHLSQTHTDAIACPPNWKTEAMDFGKLRLLPMPPDCTTLEPEQSEVIVRTPMPHGKLLEKDTLKELERTSDDAGLVQIEPEANAVCATGKRSKHAGGH